MSDDNETETTQGDGEDAGTLRTRFEGQITEKDAAIGMLQKQLAFAKVFPGVDPESKPVQAMLERYDGELTAEALTTEAKDWNIAVASEASTGETDATTQVSDEERAGHQAARSLSTDTTQTAGQKDGPHPIDRGLELFNEELKSGKTREEAAAAFVDTVLTAGAKGDERVVIAGGRRGGD